ncbi:hypothetical protein MRB53_010635 [Persea americana]|uniref:Uncharacterized protein n=1 Tax=Persea americana TaxID=3435 RepID=A0ACC2LSQ5_PERAE|nr:hypothetical protein MRB53_010635 [Persea americana]
MELVCQDQLVVVVVRHPNDTILKKQHIRQLPEHGVEDRAAIERPSDLLRDERSEKFEDCKREHEMEGVRCVGEDVKEVSKAAEDDEGAELEEDPSIWKDGEQETK